MSVFMSPDGAPFYGGTYFPNEERGGMPSFPRVLSAVAEAYRERRDDIVRNSSRVIEAIESRSQSRVSVEPIDRTLFHSAFGALSPELDWQRGGLGLQPKFPQPMLHEFLLSHASLQGNGDCSRIRRSDSHEDGEWRDLRPSRRRVPPLLGRCCLVGASFRKDAL